MSTLACLLDYKSKQTCRRFKVQMKLNRIEHNVKQTRKTSSHQTKVKQLRPMDSSAAKQQTLSNGIEVENRA